MKTYTRIFLRYTSDGHGKAMKIPVLTELGRFRISLDVLCQVIAFWTRVTEPNDRSYLKQTYATLLHQQTVTEIS